MYSQWAIMLIMGKPIKQNCALCPQYRFLLSIISPPLLLQLPCRFSIFSLSIFWGINVKRSNVTISLHIYLLTCHHSQLNSQLRVFHALNKYICLLRDRQALSYFILSLFLLSASHVNLSRCWTHQNHMFRIWEAVVSVFFKEYWKDWFYICPSWSVVSNLLLTTVLTQVIAENKRCLGVGREGMEGGRRQ